MTPAALDIAVGLLILISTAAACFRGIVKEIFTMGGFLVAVLVAWKAGHLLVPAFNGWLHVTEGKEAEKAEFIWGLLSPALAAKVAAYGGVFLLIFLSLMLVGFLLSRWIKEMGVGSLDRLLGAIFGFLRGFLLVFVFYVPCVYLVNKDKFPAWAKESFSVPVLQATFEWANRSFGLDKMIEDRGSGIAIRLDKVDLDKIGDKIDDGASAAEKELKEKIIQEEKDIQKGAPAEDMNEILPPVRSPDTLSLPSSPQPQDPVHDQPLQ